MIYYKRFVSYGLLTSYCPDTLVQNLPIMKRFLFFILLLGSGFGLHAAHLIGGAVNNIKALGNSQFYVEFDLLRDCRGAQHGGGTLTFYTKCGNTVTSSAATIMPARTGSSRFGPYSALTISSGVTAEDVSDVCDEVLNPNKGLLTSCAANGTIGGYSLYRYSVIVTLPPCSNMVVGYSLVGCRPLTNSNLARGCPAVYETVFDSRNFPLYSTPEFTDMYKPVMNANVGETFNYSVAVQSLNTHKFRYYLNCVLDSTGKCAQYATGYSGTQPLVGAYMDSLTGKFSCTPKTSGKFYIGYRIDEFDKCTGSFVASHYREVSINAQASANSAPQFTRGISKIEGKHITKLDSFTVNVQKGFPFSIIDTIIDLDTADSIFVVSNHLTNFPGSSLNLTYITKNKVEVKFTWTPGIIGNRFNKVLKLRYTDDICNRPNSSYVTYGIRFNKDRLGIRSSSGSRDTVIVFQGDTVTLLNDGVGRVNWSTLSGTTLNWNGTQRNVWGDTTVTDTNVTIRFLPQVSTWLKANGQLNACSGIKYDSIYVQLVPNFTISLATDTTVCSDLDSVQLSVRPDSNYSYTYQWEGYGNYVSNSNIRTPFVSARKAGRYSVTVTSALGGERVKHIRVRSIKGFAQLNLWSSTDTVCSGSAVTLTPGFDLTSACSVTALRLSNDSIRTHDSLGLSSGASISDIYPNPFASEHITNRQQYLYRASALKSRGMRPGGVNSLSWYVDPNKASSNLSHVFNGYTIRMTCTTQDSITTAIAGTQEVFSSATITVKPGWNKITLDSTYLWDGVSNLVIEICHTGTGKNAGMQVAYQLVNYRANLAFYGGSSSCNSNLLTLSQIQRLPVVNFGLAADRDTNDYKYSWNPTGGLLNSSGYQVKAYPQQTTTYSLVVSDSDNVCVDTLSKTIAHLSISLDAGKDTTICAHQSYALQPIVSGNYPGTYTWTPAAQFVNNGIKNAIYTSNSGGKVRLTYQNTYGCHLTDSLEITVNALPDPAVSSTGPYCATTANNPLTGVVAGGTFSGPGVNSVTGNFDATNPAVQPSLNQPKNVTIMHSVTQNGCTADTSIIVQVYPQFDTVFVGTRSFCEYEGASKLTTRHTGGVWSGTGVTGNTFEPQLAGVGVHRIKVDSIGFCGNSATYDLEVKVAPKALLPDTVYGCVNVPALLDAGNTGSSYQWNTTEVTQTISATQSGKYSVRIIGTNGCQITDSTQVNIKEICVGKAELNSSSKDIRIYPNPFDSHLFIDLGRIEIATVRIIGMDGKRILEQQTKGVDRMTLNVSSLARGSYWVQVITDTQMQYFKLLKQ